VVLVHCRLRVLEVCRGDCLKKLLLRLIREADCLYASLAEFCVDCGGKDDLEVVGLSHICARCLEKRGFKR
jgi:hypothetical protein